MNSPTRLIRIAFVIDLVVGDIGGTERQLLMLLKNLDRDRFEPHLIYLRKCSFLESSGFCFPVHYIPLKRLVSAEFFTAIFRFSRIPGGPFDIVHTLFRDSTVFGLWAARLTRCRHVVTSRRSLGYWQTGWRDTPFLLAQRSVDHIVANSTAAREDAIHRGGVAAHRVSVIANAIEFDRFDQVTRADRENQRSEWGVHEDAIVVGGVGTLRPVKDVQSLVYAAQSIIGRFPKARFVWLGGGSIDRHRALARNLGLDSHFLFPGPTANVPRALSGLDIAVQTSTSESLSNALIEYLAAGLPVVASDVGGTSDAIKHEVNGLLYNPRIPLDLERAIVRLLSDPALTAELRANAEYSVRDRYDIRTIVRQYEMYYTNIVDRNI